MPDLTIGKQLVIKGTDVSFYIPPTGIEVVAESHRRYVRNAVTLERLEYCILLDEDGNKRYIKGPAVVFPKPTETFIEKSGSRKFKAIELDENSGLYIKVIAPYEEAGRVYAIGEELFITGRDQMIYFPRTEHAVIRYGEQDVYQAVAIPTGEALYVLNRLTGQITLEKGPIMFLPDPRTQVIVRRILDGRQVELWFPGNQEALAYNRMLKQLHEQEKAQSFQDAASSEGVMFRSPHAPSPEASMDLMVSEEFVGDEFNRSFNFPRTVTLDTKYEGAVSINVWTGYAVLVISKTGERQVIVGPQNYLLEYEETLGALELSTGTPKTDHDLMRTVYLRVLHNKVSDSFSAVTSDYCTVEVKLSYRVNFEGDSERWFNVENYIKFMTDHMRSVLINATRGYGIEAFYNNAIDIIRDTVLGQPDEAGRRGGQAFEENGMRIYNVEVVEVTIKDADIAALLVDNQHSKIQQELELASEKRGQEIVRQQEAIKQRIATSKAETEQMRLDLQLAEVEKTLIVDLARIESNVAAEKKKLDARLAEQQPLDQINEADLARQKAQFDLQLAVADQELSQRLAELKGEVEAVVDKAGAISPNLIAAIQAFSDKALAEKMAESMAPLAILGGNSVADVLAQLLKGTVLERVLTDTSGEKEDG